jgi:hypothetical protein
MGTEGVQAAALTLTFLPAKLWKRQAGRKTAVIGVKEPGGWMEVLFEGVPVQGQSCPESLVLLLQRRI